MQDYYYENAMASKFSYKYLPTSKYLNFIQKFSNSQVPNIFYDITKKPQYNKQLSFQAITTM